MADLRAAVLCTVVTAAAAFLGVDVSDPVDAAGAACLKTGGASFGVARAWHSFGGFDAGALTTLASFQQAGIAGDVYLFPCPNKPAGAQVQQMLGNLSGAPFNYVWLDIEENPSTGCGWSSDKVANCRFLQSMVLAVNASGKPVGIYTSIHEYELLVSDSAQGCALGNLLAPTAVPLWYPHYEVPPQANFDDWEPFGSWSAPTIKQFNDAGGAGTGLPADCVGGMDVNWAPTMPPMV